jgi:WD40 repeat protein/predicted Ser/Thr protein kinase
MTGSRAPSSVHQGHPTSECRAGDARTVARGTACQHADRLRWKPGKLPGASACLLVVRTAQRTGAHLVYDPPPGGGRRQVGAVQQPGIQRIGPYDILEPLGRGGMGVVYRALHRDLQQQRAIKVLPPHLAADETFVSRFKREATIAAGLRHPNVVLIFDVGQQDDFHYIVMELVSGRSLREVIRADKPLPLDRIVRLLRPLADALDFAHGKGVVHRDIKPTNIIIGTDDKVTLLDFGIARAAEGAQQLTRAGLVIGTPEYMAPEVVVGGAAGANADLYALGIVAFEMLTGHVPFHGANTTAVAFAHVHTQPPSPRADRADLPDAVERVLLRQLAKNPRDRYPSARAFVDALETSAQQAAGPDETIAFAPAAPPTVAITAAHAPPGAPVSGPRLAPPLTPPGARPAARRGTPWPMVAGVAVALLLAVLGGGYGLLQLRGNDSQVAVNPTAAPTSKPAVTAGPGATSAPLIPQPTAPAQPTQPPPIPPPASKAGPTAQIDEARAAIQASDFTRAISLLTAVKQADPAVFGADDLLFQAYIGQGRALLPADPDASRAAFDEARKLRPNDADAQAGQRQATVAGLRRRAEASAGRDDDAAIAAWQELLTLAPDDADARGKLYSLLIATADRLFGSDAAQARDILQQATSLDPARPEARERLARFAVSAATAERVREVARWGKGTANSVALSPNSRQLAVGSSYGVYLYDAVTHAETGFLQSEQFVWGVAYSPDGRELAAATGTGNVIIWRVADGAPLRTLTGHEAAVISVAYSPDGQRLVTASLDKTARIWNLGDGATVRTLSGHEGGVRDAEFSRDGQRIATASADRTARIWNAQSGALTATLRGHSDEVTSIAFSPDGQSVATAAQDQTARVWRVADGGQVRTLSGHTGWVQDIAYTPDGQTLVSASADNTARTWRVADGTLLHTLQGHTGWVVTATIASDGQSVVTGSRDGTVRFWRVAEGGALAQIDGLSSLVRGLAISQDGQLIAAGLEDGEVVLVRASDGTTVHTLAGHRDAVYGVAFSPDSQTLATGSDDRTIRLWRVADGAPIRTMTGHTDWVRVVRFGNDPQLLFSGSADKTVRTWRVADGESVRTFSDHEWGVSSLAISPDNLLLATGTADTPIRLFRTAEQSPPRMLREHKDWVNGLAISGDSTLLASASADKTVRLWDLPDGRLVRTLEGHTDIVASVALSQDAQLVASSSWDGTVRLWRTGDGGILRTLEGHTQDVNVVAISPDGQSLVSGSSDGTIRIWAVR